MASSSHSTSTLHSELPEKFHPGKSLNFPNLTFGKKNEERSYRAEWCEKYPWLHYNIERESAFCYLCMKEDHEGKFFASTKHNAAFLSRGFTYWRKQLQLVANQKAIYVCIS